MPHAVRLLVGWIALGAASPALAEYPERPITLLCWSNPGSPNDRLARAIARAGERHFGQKITVLNRRGGSGALAMTHLLKRRKDGYTLSTLTASQLINMASGRLPFRPRQFTYLMRIGMEPFVIAVRADSPFQSLADLFDHAKKNPGELSISGFGAVSSHFLAFSRLASAAGGADIRWIPYDGGGDAAVACLGGHTDAVHTNSVIVGEHVRAGKLRVLGVSSAERLLSLPGVPTYQEQGYDIQAAQIRGVMGPGGLPADVVTRIRSLLERTVKDPLFQAYLNDAELSPAWMTSPAAFQGWVEREVVENRELMKALNLPLVR